MKNHLVGIILGAAAAFLFAARAYATETKPQILSDQQLGAIEGGYCLFWKCEGPPGTAPCQPIKNDTVDLCKTVTCRLAIDMEGNTEILQCGITGATVTCTEDSTYVQCVRARQPNLCVRDVEDTGCGLLVRSYCFPDIKHRTCFCDSGSDTTPCDWTSCVH